MFWVAADSSCIGNDRCQVVQALESSTTEPWYYVCNVTLSNTFGDPMNISYVSDSMAKIAASAIAQTGFADENGESSQLYPPDSAWGTAFNGSSDLMGLSLANFALGAIAGASVQNLQNTYFGIYNGNAPNLGVILQVSHPKLFYLTLGAIAGAHLFFMALVAYLANRVKVGPEGTLSMALLLRPIADALDGVSGGKKNQALKDAKKNTMIRYEKGPNGRWKMNMC